MKAIPGVAKITPGYNPATWMLEVSNVEEEIQLGVDFADIYKKSSLFQYEPRNLPLNSCKIYSLLFMCFCSTEYIVSLTWGLLLLNRRNKALVNELRVPAPGSKDLSFPTQFPLNFVQQLWCILWKQNLTYWRSPDYNLVRGFFTFCTALICGSIFWGVGRK